MTLSKSSFLKNEFKSTIGESILSVRLYICIRYDKLIYSILSSLV